MLIGRYYHTLEAKGRLSLPKAFRAVDNHWIVTRGLDGGLFLFRKSKFQEELTKLSERTFTKKDNRDFVRLMANEAHEVTIDKLGRVLLPEYLIEFAKLKKQVVMTGSYNYIEIWDQTLYHQYIEATEKQAEKMAERIKDES